MPDIEKENNMYSVLDLSRTYTLADLISKCAKEDILINRICYLYYGFQVFFQGFEGDAILHDGSLGRDLCMLETCGMPWDNNDVSIHTTDELISLLKEYKK